ncbi:MAG TPA: serine hydrolase [Candidatus Limnocylindria bacterium]|nr:serine hydrolase [Candidatus Limnocylindria bacterium]
MPELTNAPARLRLIMAAILGLILATLSLLPGNVARVAASDPIPDDLQAALWTALRAARQNSIAPGMSMSVLTADGRQWSGSDGWETNGDMLTVDDPMLIGSVTKTFTAAIILQLAQEGRLNINDRTSTYLHNVRLVKHTTIRQLLGHTSGIADLYQPALGVLQGAPDTSLSSNGVLRPIGENYFPPGHGYHYSNTNYYLLGLVIEHVTGRTVEQEIQDRFRAPMALEHTRMLTPDDPRLPAAWSTAFWTAGAMVSTPTELARWGQALYTGYVVSAANTRRMLDFTDGDYYGLGAQLLPLGGRWEPGHSGLMYDTTTLLIHLREENLTIAIAANAPNADLETALTGTYGGPSILELVESLAG